MNLGNAIKTARKNADYNQSEFSKMVGISQTYLSQIENGKKTPNMSVITKAAKCLNVPTSIMLWYGLEESDINPKKLDIYKHLQPTINALILELI